MEILMSQLSIMIVNIATKQLTVNQKIKKGERKK